MAAGFKRSLLGGAALAIACSTTVDDLPPSAPPVFASSSGFTSSSSTASGFIGDPIDEGSCTSESCPGLCAHGQCCDDDHVFCNHRGNPVCCPPGWRCIDHACFGSTILPTFDAGGCGDEPDPAISLLGGPCDPVTLEVVNGGGGTVPEGLVIEVKRLPDAGSMLLTTPRPLTPHESVTLRTNIVIGGAASAEIVDAGAGNCDAGNDTARTGAAGMKECL